MLPAVMLFAAKTAQGALPSELKVRHHILVTHAATFTPRERERKGQNERENKGREMCRAVDAHSEAFTTGYVESNI